MYQLKSTDGDGQVLVFPLHKPRMTVGRDPSNDIVLTDPDVSRWHCVLTHDGRELLLRDMESTNGSFVNTVRIYDPVTLKIGDLLIIGSNLFAVGVDQDGDAAVDRTRVVRPDQLGALPDPDQPRATPAGQPVLPSAAFDQTILRDKHGMLEGAFEKKVQVARFPRLECGEGDKQQCFLLAMPVFRIGRGADSHLHLNDAGVSQKHAEIHVSAEGNILVDLNSTNGTTVNGRRVRRHELRDGDLIRVGDRELTYRHRDGTRGRFGSFLKSLFFN